MASSGWVRLRALRRTTNVVCGRKEWNIQRHYAQLARVQVGVEESAKESMESEEYSPKRHQGVFFRGTVMLPVEFVETSKEVLARTGAFTQFKNKVNDLANYLYCRAKPVEKEEYKEMANSVESRVKSKDAFLEPFLSESELQKLESKRFEQTKNYLRRFIYHWEPVSYAGDIPYVYLLSRSAPEYAVLYKIFYEITMRDPKFRPNNLLDFGSGVGSVLWAANAFWNKSLNEHLCVDASVHMNELAEMLLRGGVNSNQTKWRNVFFRQFLPTSPTPKFDIVVSAYAMLELSSRKSRIETLSTLWRKTNNYLVIVERGNNHGFEVLNEARDFLLQLDRGGTDTCHAFSPCPHDKFCGKYVQDNKACAFEVTYLSMYPFDKKIHLKEKYSYVVIKKGPRLESAAWPRSISPPLKKPRHVICRLCMPDGSLAEAVVTKNRHSRPAYKTVRQSRLGDLLPLEKKDVDLTPYTREEEDEQPEAEFADIKETTS